MISTIHLGVFAGSINNGLSRSNDVQYGIQWNKYVVSEELEQSTLGILCQPLADFHNSFTARQIVKYPMKPSLRMLLYCTRKQKFRFVANYPKQNLEAVYLKKSTISYHSCHNNCSKCPSFAVTWLKTPTPLINCILMMIWSMIMRLCEFIHLLYVYSHSHKTTTYTIQFTCNTTRLHQQH